MIGSASAELFRNYFDIRLSGVSIPRPVVHGLGVLKLSIPEGIANAVARLKSPVVVALRISQRLFITDFPSILAHFNPRMVDPPALLWTGDRNDITVNEKQRCIFNRPTFHHV